MSSSAGLSGLPLLKKKTGKKEEKATKVPTDVVGAARPTNTEAERIKFFSGVEGEETYEPQFLYKLPTPTLLLALKRYSSAVQVETRYMPHALRILRTLLNQYGSYGRYEEQNGGEELHESEARSIVDEYLAKNGTTEINVIFDPHLVARASFTKKAGNLRIRPQGLRRHWIQGMLHHEIGTHYLRDKNDKIQPWARERNGRKKYRLEDKNPTEEGLASLHTVLEREGHCLWRAALLYYATLRASQLSFRELYEDLEQFLGDSTDERWDYCVRAKRGLLDTSNPGGFVKDQMYLTGAMGILEQRHRIDFDALYIGKLSVVDAHRAKCTGLARIEHVQLPVFLQSAEQKARYIELLDECVKGNDLCDLVDRRSAGSEPLKAGGGGGGGPAVVQQRKTSGTWTELPPVANFNSTTGGRPMRRGVERGAAPKFCKPELDDDDELKPCECCL